MIEEKQLKDTLNLPNTTLAMRANAAIREVEIQKFWEENNIYQKMLEKNKANQSFILHDGPPYLSSDKIHIGHALNKILKDIVLKYKTQLGYYTNYVPGYDAHGLPIENAVVKNIKGGKSALTPLELRQKCREFAAKNLKGQEENFKRMGILGDWDHPYVTIAGDFEAHQVELFWQMYQKGYIQKGLKPVYWCADCETALAEAEVEYADISSDSIYVKFAVENEQELYKKAGIASSNKLNSIIWTTTPWTIPSNVAICLNSRFDYTIFEYKNENYFVATDLLETFTKDVEWSEIKVLGNLSGAEFENFEAKHPLYDKKSLLILGDHVTLDAGTGAVHTAPGHGLEDWEAGQKYGLETFSPFDSKGCWTAEVPDLEGVPYYKGNAMVIEKLKAIGALIKSQEIMHSYPHCWRCKHPVMYRSTPQWFVKVSMFKDIALENIKNVTWYPASGEKRISNMVENRSEWCISRQRAWGVPIPILYCKDCGKPIITQDTIKIISDKFKAETSDAWVKYEAKDFIPSGFKCECGCAEFEKENDIMDVWFDSGSSWSAVVAQRADEFMSAQTKDVIPVDMYLEGSDQHRGWFQSSLLISSATKECAPYKSVLTHGFVLDGEGRKMSKSLGNIVTPQEIIKVYGVDVLRLWAASVDYRNDVKIGDNLIKQLVEVFKKTRNTIRFLMGNLFDFDPKNDYVKYEELEEIDKFALSRLAQLIKNVNASFETYEFYKYFQHLQNFASTDLSSFYLDIVKDRLYTQGKKSLSRRACQTVMFEILMTLVKILVPVMPHQAEDIWQNMQENQKDVESALLLDWASAKDEWINEKLDEEFTQLLKTREIVSKAIEPLRSSEEKVVGSSLEVDILINSESKAKAELLEKYSKLLGDLYIVSHVYTQKADFEALNDYSQDEYSVKVAKAKGEKCARCWKYRELNINGICQDCEKAIKE
ncbi:MAG: isoleucine--tRNA ligase [Candidatus Gastranaerophilales bacterium]|nr:isoleucine--tRNA ligase [Candidatus Gastranaerophilales bacterium]